MSESPQTHILFCPPHSKIVQTIFAVCLFFLSPAPAFPVSVLDGFILFLVQLTETHVFRAFSCGMQQEPN